MIALLAPPVFTPDGGTYTSPLQVTITDSTANAAIYYTTDGTLPTANSALYTSTISVSATKTFRAIAISGNQTSAVSVATYTITVTAPQVAATPVISPPGGNYTSAQQVSITDTTPSGQIYYTTDGSTPTQASTPYSTAIAVSSSETIQAIAYAAGYSQSAVASATYTFTAAPLPTGVWTWMSGSNKILPAGVFGTQGVAAPGNAPGARDGSIGWADSAGNFWIFGGGTYDAAGKFGSGNDLWEFDPTTSEWKWVSGSSSNSTALGVYGTLGVSAASNVPGGRIPDAVWTDGAGRFWLFGGNGNDSIQGSGVLDDIWMFDPVTSVWTWEGGDDALGKPGIYGTQGVAAAANHPGARATSAYWKDVQGRFWLFGGNGIDSVGAFNTLNDLWMFNPNTKQWTWVSGSKNVNAAGVYGTQGVASGSNIPGARYQAFGWGDPSGDLWVFGGETSTPFVLLNDLWKFNPASGQWTWVTGSSTPGAIGSYGTQGVALATNTPGTRYAGASASDGNGGLYLSSGAGDSSTGLGKFNDIWRFNTGTGKWTWLAGSETTNVGAVYGTLGVSAPENHPGVRYFVTGWLDASGAFWLFSGNSYVANGQGDSNDLWRYQP